MSLRLRLLLAVGAIAIVALVVADFATYSALRTSLYNQVDQELAAPAPPPANQLTPGTSCALAAGGAGGGGSGRRQRGEALAAAGVAGVGEVIFPNSSASATLSVVNRRRRCRRGPGVPGLRGHARLPTAAPLADHRVSRPSPTALKRRTSRRGRWHPSGPSFRVKAQKVTAGDLSGDVLVQAQPLGDQTQHAPHPFPHRARRDGRRTRAGPGRRLVVGPARPAPAGRRGAHSGFHRGGRPRPASSRCRPADRGRSPGPRPQRDVGADSSGLLGAGRLGGPAA